MDIVIHLDKIATLFSMQPDIFLSKFFLYFGWLPISMAILWGIWQLWIYYIFDDYDSKRTYILLAIDIPVANEQTPKAIEQMFAHLAGAHTTINLTNHYWIGKDNDPFSFEIASIEGYTQFLIRCMPRYRDLIESVIYAQYPDAEITEVNDYTEGYPDKFPDDTYDIWGAEWIPVQDELLPFKTYLDFEHQFSGDFKDPMAAFMEMFGSLRKGEQLWYQIIVVPTGFEWSKRSEDVISDIVGDKVIGKKGILDFIPDTFLWSLEKLGELIISIFSEIGTESKEEEKKEEFKMMNLRPSQKKQVEAVQQKVSKLGFECKIRFVYIAEKEVKNMARPNSFVGAMKQFSLEDVNSLKPDMATTATSTSYFWKKSRLNERKTKLIRAYKSRSKWIGKEKFILNIEELATLWHFPVESAVVSPMLQKTPSRRTEAPSFLPIEGSTSDMASDINIEGDIDFEESLERPATPVIKKEKEEIFSEEIKKEKEAEKKSGPPTNLPI